MNENELLRKRFAELHDRAVSRGIWTYSDFLSLAEKSELLSLRLDFTSLCGGYASAERRMACFGGEDICGYEGAPPIACVKIEPVNKKFSDDLNHRDFLGAVMATGIDRAVLGDVLVRDNTAWVFCRDDIADYIASSVDSVRRTTVKCSVSEPPDFINEAPPISQVAAASERLDAVISGVYGMSRSESRQLVEGGRVFIDGRLCQAPSAEIKSGVIISVRGTGRFKYEGIEKLTRSGRIRLLVRKY